MQVQRKLQQRKQFWDNKICAAFSSNMIHFDTKDLDVEEWNLKL